MRQKKSLSSKNYYLAKPRSGKGRGVLVLHAWWGLNPFMRSFCDRLAKAGFVALAPDLYHGAVASTIAEAKKLSSTLKEAMAAKEVKLAAKQLQRITGSKQRRIGVLGFSLGGGWALWLAQQKANPLAATVVFYETWNADYTHSRCAFQFHLAERDHYAPTSHIKPLAKNLKAAGKLAEFHTYAGTTHWFFERDRHQAYKAPAAQLAWRRTVKFLKSHVR